MKEPLISLCMIVRNEEENLPGCLESVQGLVDEIVIVDTGSQDSTVIIAEAYGAKVFHMPWLNDFAAARNKSLDYASGDWIFYLDADERLDSNGHPDCIRQVISNSAIDAWSVLIKSRKYGAATVDATYNIRLFRNLPEVRFENEVHERVEPALSRIGAKISTTPFFIDHLGYMLKPDAMKEKLSRNILLSQKHLEREPDDPYCLYYLGATLLLLGRASEGREHFQRALDSKEIPLSMEAMTCNFLAFLELQEGRSDEAIAYAQRSSILVSRQNTCYLLNGIACFRKSQFALALPLLYKSLEFLQMPVENRPTDLSQEHSLIDAAEFHKLIGICLSETGKPGDALLHFTHFFQLGGEDPEITWYAGICAVNTGDFISGLRYLEKAEQLGVRHSEIALPMAYACIKLKHFDRAKLILDKAEEQLVDIVKLGNIRSILQSESQVASHDIVANNTPGEQDIAQFYSHPKSREISRCPDGGVKLMPQKVGLSVCMIVKNESANLGDALASFTPFADEIVVVDTGSTDNTKEIAARFTPHVYDFEWIDDFSAARNFAMSKATGSYQLWLDADDRFSPDNQQHINSLKKLFDGKKAFYFILENYQTDAPSSFCRQLRCTPLIPELQFEGRIHEQIFPSAVRKGLDLVSTDIVVRHIGYTTEEIRLAKAKRNLEFLERERAAGGDHGGLYFFLAMTHAPMGNREEAIHCMKAALERFEKEYYNHHLIPEGYLFLAQLSFEQEDADRCLRYLVKAGSLTNGSPQHNFQIGILYQRLGRHIEAIGSFKKLCGVDYVPSLFPTQSLPSSSEILLHMAYSCYCRNDRQGAVKLINASAGEGSDPGKSWEWMGTKAFAFRNMGLAQLAFETALRFGDLERQSWGYLASLYKFAGFLEKSEECLQKASNEAVVGLQNLPSDPASFSAQDF